MTVPEGFIPDAPGGFEPDGQIAPGNIDLSNRPAEAATKYAERLHEQQAEVYGGDQQQGTDQLLRQRLAERRAKTAAATNVDTDALGRGAAQGASLGFFDELKGAAKAAGVDGLDYLVSLAGGPAQVPILLAKAGLGAADKAIKQGTDKLAEDYRQGRDKWRAGDKAAQERSPGTFRTGQIGGAVATSFVPGAAPATLSKAALAGAAFGAGAGLGSSEADLTKGDVGGAAADTAVGATLGGALGAAAKPVSNLVGAAFGGAAKKLLELGRSRLFKAAVGQTKRAFTQMNGKGLLDKAGEYLDSLGIGFGDSTESIAQKLGARRDSVGQALDDMVSSLDQASGGRVAVSPGSVADRIEKEVAAPLKKLAAAQGEYEQVMREVDAIRQIGQPLGFAESAAQRAAAQKQINYDVQNGRDIAAQARREIARIWNDEIDKQAEPLLKSAGKAGDAYRELRHEFSLAEELMKHVTSRVQGNAANRVLSPSDYGVGGIAGIMTGNPFLGVAGAAANHLGRVYGNAAAGRAAINMAKLASMNETAAQKLLPTTIRSGRVGVPQLEVLPAAAQNKPDDKKKYAANE